MRGIDPFVAFILIVLIGIAMGLVFDRFAGPSWHTRQFPGYRGWVTASLVGVAGSFIGYYLSALGGMVGFGGYAIFIGAAAAAALTVFAWRMIR